MTDDDQETNTSIPANKFSRSNECSSPDNTSSRYVGSVLAWIVGIVATVSITIITCTWTLFNAVGTVLAKQKDTDALQQSQIDLLNERSVSVGDRVEFEVRLRGAEKDISTLKSKH